MRNAETHAVGAVRPAPVMQWASRNGQLIALLGALVLLMIYNVIFTRNFVSIQTLNVNLTQVANIVIISVGMTFVIATGGIDISVGSLMAIAGALAPTFFLTPPGGNHTLGLVLAFTLPVLLAGFFGVINGTLVTRFNIQPIIATLVFLIGGRGIAQVITNGTVININDPQFQFIGLGKPFGIPFQVIIMLVVVVIAAWVLRSTVFGRYVLAVGGNEKAARLAGVPVARVKVLVYTISGLLAGIAGLIVIAINSSADASLAGQGIELDCIAAVAVGGTNMAGGSATISGTLVGALFIQLIRYTLLANGVPDAWSQIIKGIIIVAAVYLQLVRRPSRS